PAHQDVVVHARAQVADVRAGLHGDATQVDTRLAGFARGEVAHRAGGGVVQAQGHASRLSASGYPFSYGWVMRSTSRASSSCSSVSFPSLTWPRSTTTSR